MKRILILDDDPQIIELLKGFLSSREMDVLGFNGATDAIRALAESKVDAVISDIMMPGMDGIEFLRATRRVAPEIPVLLITGFPKLEFVRKAIEFGAVDFLPKPLNLAQLDQAIHKILDRAEAPPPKKLSWREKRLSRKIHKRMFEKEIRHLDPIRKLFHRAWLATEDVRAHPWFYVLSLVASGGIMWVVGTSVQSITSQESHVINLLERAVNALEEDNRIDIQRQP